jgi:hypothetical protein
MDSEELGGSFVIAVEEHGPPGLWSSIKEVSSSEGLRMMRTACIATLQNRTGLTFHRVGSEEEG